MSDKKIQEEVSELDSKFREKRMLDWIQEELESFIKKKHGYILDNSGETSDLVDYFSQGFKDQASWHYNHVPYFPN